MAEQSISQDEMLEVVHVFVQINGADGEEIRNRASKATNALIANRPPTTDFGAEVKTKEERRLKRKELCDPKKKRQKCLRARSNKYKFGTCML